MPYRTQGRKPDVEESAPNAIKRMILGVPASKWRISYGAKGGLVLRQPHEEETVHWAGMHVSIGGRSLTLDSADVRDAYRIRQAEVCLLEAEELKSVLEQILRQIGVAT